MNKLWGVWELGDKIGQGSFGEVYKAQKTELGKTFYSAIKHISLPKSQDEVEDIVHEGYATTTEDVMEYYKDTIDDLVKEIEIMYELRANKNIVDYQDHLIIEKTDGEIGFDIYIRMELLKSLDRYLESKQLKEKEVLKLGMDIATALDVCSKHDLLHRDIKPANIFIDDKGIFKLGDFGVARKLEKTTYGMSKKGTYNYMSPEIYKGDKANISSDIYSLGIVMYRLLNNNKAPFIDKDAKQVKASDAENALMKRMSGEELPDIEGVSPELMKVIKKASAFYQKNRYKEPKELLEDLKKIEQGESVDIDELDKTVSIYEDELDKTVSIYQDELEKTVSIYDTKGKKGVPESDDELRERIRKIVAEESQKIALKGETKYESIRTYYQQFDRKIAAISFIICFLLFIYSLIISSKSGLRNGLLVFPFDIVQSYLTKRVADVISITDFIVLVSFVISLFSRKSQKISSYGYLTNVGIYFLTFIYVLSKNCRVSPTFIIFPLFSVALYFINYKWTLGVKTIDVEEEQKALYEEKDKNLEIYYEKPYQTKKGKFITLGLFLVAIFSMLGMYYVPIKKQSNPINPSVKQVMINNDYIHIRKEASTKSDIMGMVYEGEIYTVLGEKNDFYLIETEYGVRGYIANRDDWIAVISGE